MRVTKSYYLAGYYDKPEKVTAIVRWANALMNGIGDSQDAHFRMAKRIKSLCLKHYNLSKNSNIRFCKDWEEHPWKFMNFVLMEFPDGNCKIVRKITSGPFSPDNLVLVPKA